MPIAQPWAFCNPPLAPQVAQDWGTFSQHAFCTIMTGCMVMLCSSATTLENLKGQCHAVFTLFPFISIKKNHPGASLTYYIILTNGFDFAQIYFCLSKEGQFYSTVLKVQCHVFFGTFYIKNSTWAPYEHTKTVVFKQKIVVENLVTLSL